MSFKGGYELWVMGYEIVIEIVIEIEIAIVIVCSLFNI